MFVFADYALAGVAFLAMMSQKMQRSFSS